MKILHIISSTSQSNGAMNVIMNYYREVVKYDIQFDFLYFEDSCMNYNDEIKKKGGKCINCTGKNKLESIKKIRNYIKYNDEYDIIENHELYLTKIIPKVKSKLILHSHTTAYSQRLLSSIRNKILCANIDKCADYYFSCSIESACVFWPNIIKSKKFSIVHNAISYDKCKYSSMKRKKIRDFLNISNSDIVLGYIARFDNGKNHEFLIKLMQFLLERKNNYKLLLVGTGETEKNIKKIVYKNNLSDKIIFAGQISSEKINEYLSAMDMFLFPSKNEGLGQVAIEAQGNGLKCIVSTKIPLDAKISNNYIRLPLKDKSEKKDNVEEWYNTIVKNSTKRKFINFNQSGYDIKNEAKLLADLYKRLL